MKLKTKKSNNKKVKETQPKQKTKTKPKRKPDLISKRTTKPKRKKKKKASNSSKSKRSVLKESNKSNSARSVSRGSEISNNSKRSISKGSEKSNSIRSVSRGSEGSYTNRSISRGSEETYSERSISRNSSFTERDSGSKTNKFSNERGRTREKQRATPLRKNGTTNSISLQGSVIDVESQEKPWLRKSKHEPIVYSCCGFCSLGAGSLLTGIIYIGFCVGFLVYRVGEFKLRTKEKFENIWDPRANIFRNIWHLIIISGIAFASLSMIGALVLLVASCLFGQKEHFGKMKVAVILWSCLTGIALLFNVGEAVYLTILPQFEFEEFRNSQFPDPKSVAFVYKDLKENLPKAWGLTGAYTLFYVYLIIVLVSYLRLLKYKNAPKVGKDPTSDEEETKSYPGNLSAATSFHSTKTNRTDRRSSNSISRRSLRSEDGNRTPRSFDSRSMSQASLDGGIQFRADRNTYINWPMLDETKSQDSALGHSPIDEIRHREEVESLASSAVYDLPPTNVYDETPIYDVTPDQVPALIPKRNNTSKVTTLQGRAEAALQLTNSMLSNGQGDNMPTPSGGAGFSRSEFSPSQAYSVSRDDSLLGSTLGYASSLTSRPSSHFQQNTLLSQAKEEEVSKEEIDPDALSKFFKHLDNQQTTSNPLEEMFRLFGGDLCEKHPENCDRYLKSYKDIRSKTSNISSMRDHYEFEKLGGITPSPLPPLRQQFPLEQHIYSTNTSLHENSMHRDEYPSLPLRAPREQLYGYQSHGREHMEPPKLPRREHYRQRPFSRDTGRSMPSHRPNSHHSIYSTLPARHPQAMYYDDDCSTCYGDFGDYMYGDFGSYYSYYGYYPPPPPRPQPVYSPSVSLRSKPLSYDPSMSQFSVMSNIRRPSRNSFEPHWYPVNTQDNYSIYSPEDQYFLSNKSRSLPNLAEAVDERTISGFSGNASLGNPIQPEFTVPSPREVNLLSRSTSWASSFAKPDGSRRGPSERRPSMRSRANEANSTIRKNYSGYHTGDLRSRTSHNTLFTNDSWQDRPSTRNSNVPSIPSVPPRLGRSSSKDTIRRNDRLDSSCSFFLDDIQQETRASSRPPRTVSRETSQSFSQQPLINSRSNSFRLPSRESSRLTDPYPDKHIGLKSQPTSILRSREPSVDDSKALLPFEGRSTSKTSKVNAALQRSKSVRHSIESDSKPTTKQVKFGSTPNLHDI